MIERDFELLRLLSELARKFGSEWLEASDAEAAAAEAGIEGDDFTESLHVLRHRRLIDAETGISGNLFAVEVTPVGFDTYALRHVDGYEALLGRAGRWLFERRDDYPFNTQLAAAIGVDRYWQTTSSACLAAEAGCATAASTWQAGCRVRHVPRTRAVVAPQ
jgi:hypothetical protein